MAEYKATTEVGLSSTKTYKESYIKEFSEIQTKFYTSFSQFDNVPNYDIKKHGFVLMQGIAKGFPNLANMIGNLKFIDMWGFESPALFKALQRSLSKNRSQTIPSFVYFKSKKIAADKSKTRTITKKDKNLVDFDKYTISDICSALMYDAKTYDYLKYTPRVQKLGKEIVYANEQKLIQQLEGNE
jgi:hypothetical protein